MDASFEQTGSSWQGARCVVMCGGRSTRFLSSGEHKSMAPVLGIPLIERVINFWTTYTDDFVFVVKHGREALTSHVRTLAVRSEFVEPEELRGIAHGLCSVESLISRPFIVVLGDCFCAGRFVVPPGTSAGIGVWRTAETGDIRRNYAVEVDERQRVLRVIEKPEVVTTDLCGLGYYFFQPGVFEAIRATPPSRRTGHVEITDVVQTLIDSGTPVQALMLRGHYVNVTVPEDIGRVERLLLE